MQKNLRATFAVQRSAAPQAGPSTDAPIAPRATTTSSPGGSPSVAEARRFFWGGVGAKSAARARRARTFGLATNGKEQLLTSRIVPARSETWTMTASCRTRRRSWGRWIRVALRRAGGRRLST